MQEATTQFRGSNCFEERRAFMGNEEKKKMCIRDRFMAVLELIKDGSILLEKRIGSVNESWGAEDGYDVDGMPYEFYCTLNHDKEDWETVYEPAG